MATGTLNTNTLNAVAAALVLTSETLVTLYVSPKTGAHNNHRVLLEASPNAGLTWIVASSAILGRGCLTISVVATNIRAKVVEVEGVTSTVTVHILAK